MRHVFLTSLFGALVMGMAYAQAPIGTPEAAPSAEAAPPAPEAALESGVEQFFEDLTPPIVVFITDGTTGGIACSTSPGMPDTWVTAIAFAPNGKGSAFTPANRDGDPSLLDVPEVMPPGGLRASHSQSIRCYKVAYYWSICIMDRQKEDGSTEWRLVVFTRNHQGQFVKTYDSGWFTPPIPQEDSETPGMGLQSFLLESWQLALISPTSPERDHTERLLAAIMIEFGFFAP